MKFIEDVSSNKRESIFSEGVGIMLKLYSEAEFGCKFKELLDKDNWKTQSVRWKKVEAFSVFRDFITKMANSQQNTICT